MKIGEFLITMKNCSNCSNQGQYVLEIISAMCGEEDPVNANKEISYKTKEFKSSSFLPDALKKDEDHITRKHLYSSYKKYKPLTAPMKEYIHRNKNANTFIKYLENNILKENFSKLCEAFKVNGTVDRTDFFKAIYEQFCEFVQYNDDNISNYIKASFNNKEVNTSKTLINETIAQIEENKLNSDLHNLNKISEIIKKIIPDLIDINCINSFPIDLFDYMNEINSAISSVIFNSQDIIEAVTEFYLKYDLFIEYLTKYTCPAGDSGYMKMKGIGPGREINCNDYSEFFRVQDEIEKRQKAYYEEVYKIVLLDNEFQNRAKLKYGYESK